MRMDSKACTAHAAFDHSFSEPAMRALTGSEAECFELHPKGSPLVHCIQRTLHRAKNSSCRALCRTLASMHSAGLPALPIAAMAARHSARPPEPKSHRLPADCKAAIATRSSLERAARSSSRKSWADKPENPQSSLIRFPSASPAAGLLRPAACRYSAVTSHTGALTPALKAWTASLFDLTPICQPSTCTPDRIATADMVAASGMHVMGS